MAEKDPLPANTPADPPPAPANKEAPHTPNLKQLLQALAANKRAIEAVTVSSTTKVIIGTIAHERWQRAQAIKLLRRLRRVPLWWSPPFGSQQPHDADHDEPPPPPLPPHLDPNIRDDIQRVYDDAYRALDAAPTKQDLHKKQPRYGRDRYRAYWPYLRKSRPTDA